MEKKLQELEARIMALEGNFKKLQEVVNVNGSVLAESIKRIADLFRGIGKKKEVKEKPLIDQEDL